MILFQCGYRSGYGIARRMNLEYTSPKHLDELLPSLCLQFGLGVFDVEEAQADLLILSCPDSKEATAMGNTGKPSCWMTAGYLAGIVSWVTERRFRCKEKECLSQGDDQCRFTIFR